MFRLLLPALSNVVVLFLALASCGGRQPPPAASEVEDAPEAAAMPQEQPPQVTPAERLRVRAAEERAARVADAPKTVTIITPATGARLCPKPDCGQGTELRRLVKGLEFPVEDVATVRLPRWSVIWYRVTYEGTTGWISEFDTSAAPPEPR